MSEENVAPEPEEVDPSAVKDPEVIAHAEESEEDPGFCVAHWF
ncbi:MAG: hypothetical protein JWQ81_5174 [Amycolatopsis sp.]|jgi:hypothetical protein|nr:hypothetical protein [Amycolatopsis sp.]MCU1684435.1 hypothetical protein [Amycolatopsis sp.]